MTQVLVFGTSTTYGTWDIEGGWVQRIRRYLDEKQLKEEDTYYIVYNLGIPGDTSKEILERIEFETKQRLKDESEEVIIIISVGANDSIYNNLTKDTKVSIENYTSNVKRIISIARKYATKIVFVGNKPVDETKVDPIPWLKGNSYKSELVEKYDLVAADLCKTEKIHFVDVYHLFQKKNYQKLLEDDVHPSTKGHKLIFEIVKRELIKERILT